MRVLTELIIGTGLNSILHGYAILVMIDFHYHITWHYTYSCKVYLKINMLKNIIVRTMNYPFI